MISKSLALIISSVAAITLSQPAGRAPTQTAVLPSLSQEIAGVRIGWRYQDMKGVVKAAQTDGKPVVILFVEDNCSWCQVQASNEIRCPTFNTLAGKAHFIVLNPNATGGQDARVIADSLGVHNFPTLSFITIKGTHVSELSRTVGYIGETQLVTDSAGAGLHTTRPRSTNPASAALGTYVPTGCLPGPTPTGNRTSEPVIYPKP